MRFDLSMGKGGPKNFVFKTKVEGTKGKAVEAIAQGKKGKGQGGKRESSC